MDPRRCDCVSSGVPDSVNLRDASRFWLQLGLVSFGGPAGQIALLHRELVERRRWLSERRYLHALNYCMLLPGPEAMQLATYLGWLMHGVPGGLIAGGLFVLPSVFVLTALPGSMPVGAAAAAHVRVCGAQTRGAGDCGDGGLADRSPHPAHPPAVGLAVAGFLGLTCSSCPTHCW